MVEIFSNLMVQRYGLHVLLTLCMYSALAAICILLKIASKCISCRYGGKETARCYFPRLDLCLLMFPLFPATLAESLYGSFNAPMCILLVICFGPFLYMGIVTIDSLFYGVIMVDSGLILSSSMWISRKEKLRVDEVVSVKSILGNVSPIGWLSVKTSSGKRYVLFGDWTNAIDRINCHLSNLNINNNEGAAHGV